jgi:hypothetical protein
MFVLLNVLTSFVSGDNKSGILVKMGRDNSMKVFTGSTGTSALILNLGMCNVDWSISHLGRFTPVKELGYSSSRSRGGSQSRSVRSEEGKDHFPEPGLEIRTVQPVEVRQIISTN